MDTMDNLKKTPLFETHLALHGKMVDFGGWALPVQYTSIIDEHKAVRHDVGLFDVSHMGEVMVTGEGAFAFIQKLVTNDITSMKPGRVRYSPMCYEDGGTVDDILIYMISEGKYLLVVNAGNTDKDFEWFMRRTTLRSKTSLQTGHSLRSRVPSTSMCSVPQVMRACFPQRIIHLSRA